jgi:hypothetical protein
MSRIRHRTTARFKSGSRAADEILEARVEVWWYSPARFAEHCMVDRLSLYLSLKADHDERTETTLEEMMEKFKR